MKYDVVVVGAGPGGIFSAYELMKKKPGLKIAVFEAGYTLEKRKYTTTEKTTAMIAAVSFFLYPKRVKDAKR